MFSFGDRKSQHLHWKYFRLFSFQESTFQYEAKLLSRTKPCICPSFCGCDASNISHKKKALPVLVSMKTPTFRDTYTGYLLSSLSFIFIHFNNLLRKKLSQLSFHFVTRTAIISKYLCRIAFIWLVATFMTVFFLMLQELLGFWIQCIQLGAGLD